MATATVEYVTVQSSDPCEFVARTVIVPELTAVGVPLITLEPVVEGDACRERPDCRVCRAQGCRQLPGR